MAALTISKGSWLRWVLLICLICPFIAGASEPEPAGGLGSRTIIFAPGARNGGGLTTVAHCTNVGTVAGRIEAAFYTFSGTFACTAAALSVAPGRTASLSVASIASMANLSTCSTPFVLNQGSVHLFGEISETLRFRCTVQLISTTGDPPTSAARLSLYTPGGAPITDILFADGHDP